MCIKNVLQRNKRSKKDYLKRREKKEGERKKINKKGDLKTEKGIN